jgi:hypothetical protein
MICPYCANRRVIWDGFLRHGVVCPVCHGMEPHCCDGDRAQPPAAEPGASSEPPPPMGTPE